MKVTEQIFEKKCESLLSQEEKERLSSEFKPLVMKDDFLSARDTNTSSYSLQSQFAKSEVPIESIKVESTLPVVVNKQQVTQQSYVSPYDNTNEVTNVSKVDEYERS
jgi:hypothetical protein